jgi:hypothetical protein
LVDATRLIGIRGIGDDVCTHAFLSFHSSGNRVPTKRRI